MDRETWVAIGDGIDRGEDVKLFAATVIMGGTKIKPQTVIAESWCGPKHGVHHNREAVAAVERVRMADHESAVG